MGRGADVAGGSGNSAPLGAGIEPQRVGQSASYGGALRPRAHRKNSNSDSLWFRSQLPDPERDT